MKKTCTVIYLFICFILIVNVTQAYANTNKAYHIKIPDSFTRRIDEDEAVYKKGNEKEIIIHSF